MKDLGDVSWFLNIWIIRDRKQRKNMGSVRICILTQLSKVPLNGLVNLSHSIIVIPFSKYRPSLTWIDSFLPIEDWIRIICSIVTKTDEAKAVLKACRIHAKSFRRNTMTLLIEFFYTSMARNTVAIEYGGDEDWRSILCTSDAVFGDNPDRKSSDGYLMKLLWRPSMACRKAEQWQLQQLNQNCCLIPCSKKFTTGFRFFKELA